MSRTIEIDDDDEEDFQRIRKTLTSFLMFPVTLSDQHHADLCKLELLLASAKAAPGTAPPTKPTEDMGAVLCAIPLKFEASKVYSDGSQEWNENTMGFHVSSDPTEPEDTRYRAAWGEGEPEDFGALEAAQAWCQQEADDWVRKIARVTTATKQEQGNG